MFWRHRRQSSRGKHPILPLKSLCCCQGNSREVADYREAYNLFACSGVLFNHESPLRPQCFVTPKIVSVACRIVAGSPEKLQLGDISVQRDWGWEPEYVEAMYVMLQQSEPDDYLIASYWGKPCLKRICCSSLCHFRIRRGGT